MLHAEQWRLEREESLDLYLTWRSMGAQPPSLLELLSLPSAIMRDFQKLGARYYEAKTRKREMEKGQGDVPFSSRFIRRPRSR